MATLNLVLDTRRARKDGTYPIVFRVRVEDKFCDIGTGYKIFKEQFDLKTNSLMNDIEGNIQLEELKTQMYMSDGKTSEKLSKQLYNYIVE